MTYFRGESQALKADEEHLPYLSGNEHRNGEMLLSRFEIEVIRRAVPVLHDLICLRLSTGLAGGGRGEVCIPFWRREWASYNVKWNSRCCGLSTEYDFCLLAEGRSKKKSVVS